MFVFSTLVNILPRTYAGEEREKVCWIRLHWYF